MNRTVKIVFDSFAICEDNIVIAVVTKLTNTQWGVLPMVECEAEPFNYIPLRDALRQAMDIKRI